MATSALELAAVEAASEMHAVYRMFDRDGRLLYVGVTGDVGSRLGAHAGRRWFPRVEVIRLEWFRSRDAAEQAEWRAIRNEIPWYNVSGVVREARATPRRPLVVRPEELAGQVTLSEAVAAKVIGPTLAAVRQLAHRDPSFPSPAGQRRLAYLYEIADLRTYAENRSSRRSP